MTPPVQTQLTEEQRAQKVLERWPEFQERFQRAAGEILRLPPGDLYKLAAEDAALFASDARALADAYLAQQRVIEAARDEMEKHRHDVWCADYEAALAGLRVGSPETGKD